MEATNHRNIPEEEPVPPIGFFKLFQFITVAEGLMLFFGTLCAIGTGLCLPASSYLFAHLSDTLIRSSPLYTNSSSEFMDRITEYAVKNSLVGLASVVLSYFAIMIFNYVAIKQIFRIRDLFLKSALQQDIGWYDLHKSGDITSRLSEDLIKLEDGIGEKIPVFIHYHAAFVGCLVLGLVTGWKLALICLISFPLSLAIVGAAGYISAKLSKKELEVYGKAGSIAEEVLSSIRTVVAFGGEAKESERYSKNLVYARDHNVKRHFILGLGYGFVWFFIHASYGLGFWFGVGLVIDEDESTYTPAVMILVLLSILSGSVNFGMASPLMEAFGIAKGAGAKVFAVINRVSPINSWSSEGEQPSSINGAIRFSNVHFEYPSRKGVKILRGLNMTINRGERVALVGNSGCGKSTCIQLIQRFYDPKKGTIELDGKDLKDLNVAWLRSQIGVVGQEPVLFHTTIAENIRYGRQTATRREIISAAKQANAHGFISNLPQGYETLVGERGAQLSGGQKQRIAIARAIIRNPAILLLDEATSALDTASEAKVQKALDKASLGRTTIIVAHRLSTIRGADKIVVISKGRVVEEGTHEELMVLEGHYHALVTAQSFPTELELELTGDIPVDKKTSSRWSLSRDASVVSEISNAGDAEDDFQVYDEAENDEKPEPVRMYSILKANSPEWAYILIGTLSAVVMGSSTPLFAVIYGEMLGTLSLPDPDQMREESNIFSLYFAILGVGAGLASFLQIYTFGVAGEQLTMRLRGMTFSAMLQQEIAWFDDKANSTGILCARLSGEAAKVQGATGQRIGSIIHSLTTLLLGVSLALYYEWRIGLVTLSFTPFILLGNYFFCRMLAGEAFSSQSALERSTKHAVEALSNIKTVAGLGREQHFHRQYMNELLPAYRLSLRNTHFRGLVFAVTKAFNFFANSTSMYYGAHLMMSENVQYKDVLKVSQALLMGTASIANALAFVPNFQKGIISAANIFHILYRQPRIYDEPSYTDDDWVADGRVCYSKVRFSYPNRPEVEVLTGLDLSVLQGQTVALVGPSGCGKSTCIQLLERFYEPTEGTVTLDERDISAVLMASLRSQLGIVSQEPVLFDRTVAENIAYGDNSREVPMSEIIAAARSANIHTFIVSLPDGYDTLMGERSSQLSGGQKQRIAIARALVRNPRVLLLDEATSALDTESEKVVQEALDKAKVGRTCITIAHRLSTVQDADVICVIDRGKIAEQGKHRELMAKHGIYYKLVSHGHQDP